MTTKTVNSLIPDRATLEQYLSQLQSITKWLQSIEEAEDFRENCRINETTTTAEYREAMQFLMGVEALNLAIAYWQKLFDQSRPEIQD